MLEANGGGFGIGRLGCLFTELDGGTVVRCRLPVLGWLPLGLRPSLAALGCPSLQHAYSPVLFEFREPGKIGFCAPIHPI